MLVANLETTARFANGAQGRILAWEPAGGRGRKWLPAHDDRVCARFCHEGSLEQRVRAPGIDYLDVQARWESAPHESVMIQLPLVPAYALSIHKVQSLTMRNAVLGCLEGIFAHGQLYVLVSRVTDPQDFRLVGLPPKDLLDDVAQAWAARGLDVDQCFARAVQVSEEWEYTPAVGGASPTRGVARRLTKKVDGRRQIPVRLRPLAEALNPQPSTAAVLHRLLGWIDRADRAAQAGGAKPAFETAEGEPVFPTDQTEWWLTEFERRRKQDAAGEESSSGPETEGSENDSDETAPEGADDTSEDSGDPGGEETDEGGDAEERIRGGKEEAPHRSSTENPRGAGQREPGGADLWGPTDATGPGIMNVGNTCYLAAAVRARATCGHASEELARATDAEHGTEGRRQSAALFRQILTPARPAASSLGLGSVSPREFWRWVRRALPACDNTRRHDAQEFLLLWQQCLAAVPNTGGIEPSPTWAAWHAEAAAVPTTYVRCAQRGKVQNDGTVRGREPHRLWSAELEDGGTYAGVADALRRSAVQELPDRRCDGPGGCRGTGATKWMHYERLPQVLAVQLNRFGARYGDPKKNVRVPVEEELDLAEYLDAARSSPADDGGHGAAREVIDLAAEAGAVRPQRRPSAQSTKYRLRSIACHTGSRSHTGHYVCWVRARGWGPAAEDPPEAAAIGEPRRRPWILYDDDRPPVAAERPNAATESHAYLLFYEQVSAGRGESAAAAPGGAASPTAAERAHAADGAQADDPEESGRGTADARGIRGGPRKRARRALPDDAGRDEKEDDEGPLIRSPWDSSHQAGADVPSPTWGGEIEADEAPLVRSPTQGGRQPGARPTRPTGRVEGENAAGAASEALDVEMEDAW